MLKPGVEWSYGVESWSGVVFLEWFFWSVFFGVEFWSGFLESNFGVSFADFSLDNQTESTNRQTNRQADRQIDSHTDTITDR